FVVGALGLGSLADKWGRKRTLLLSVACFAVLSFITASADSFASLCVYRILVGIGVGGAAPCFVGLATEYAPASKRPQIIAWMWTGIPVGGIAGGLFASYAMPQLGWQSLFVYGGIAPALLAIVVALVVPESYSVMLRRPGGTMELKRLLRRLAPGAPLPENVTFSASARRNQAASVRHLFIDGNSTRTTLLWLACFLVWLTLTAMTAWSALLLKMDGMSAASTGLAMALNMVGATLGTVFMGSIIRVAGRYASIIGALVIAAVAANCVGLANSYGLVMACVFAFGCSLSAAVAGLIVLAATTYPADIRSTAVGWAVGIGRIGSFAGPLLIGVIMAVKPGIWAAFAGMAFACLSGAGIVLALGTHVRRRASPHAVHGEFERL
ncbi:MAG: MFS transporter, partial [Achromobacter sp.]